MEKLTLYFEDGAVALGPIGQSLLGLLGGLDLSQPTRWGRYGMGLCEDYIGYPVLSPRDILPEELYGLISTEARKLGISPCMPRASSAAEILLAINLTTRAISAANGHPLSENTMTNMDTEMNAPDADDMFLAVLENLGDGTDVQNYTIRASF